MDREQTLVILKPDCVRRGLIGEVISRFERKKLKIRKMDFRELPLGLVEQHYIEHKDKDFYSTLVRFMSQGCVVVMILEGFNAVAVVRRLLGATQYGAEPGSIRGDFAELGVENIAHASDSVVSAEREIQLFFVGV